MLFSPKEKGSSCLGFVIGLAVLVIVVVCIYQSYVSIMDTGKFPKGF